MFIPVTDVVMPSLGAPGSAAWLSLSPSSSLWAHPAITGSLITIVLPFDLDSWLSLALICGYVLLSSAADHGLASAPSDCSAPVACPMGICSMTVTLWNSKGIVAQIISQQRPFKEHSQIFQKQLPQSQAINEKAWQQCSHIYVLHKIRSSSCLRTSCGVCLFGTLAQGLFRNRTTESRPFPLVTLGWPLY